MDRLEPNLQSFSVPPLPELAQRWAALRQILERTPPSWAWAHIKTLAGGWTTSARIPSAQSHR
eukprot:1570417-Pyramimonas_sp.AAC.1